MHATNHLGRSSLTLRFWPLFLALVSFPLFAAEPLQQPPLDASPRGPLSPANALASFQLDPDLTIELVAAEPQVIDPVSIAFDEHRNLWVVEMTDYPLGPPAGQPPFSRIRILTDQNGDGLYETAKIFADKLLFVTGLLPWKGGAIVTLAGEVAYFKDTNGDGTADLHQTWFQGFAQQNSQLRANHPRLGLDGKIYIANGLRGGQVVAVEETWKKKQPPLNLNGMDFRFDPETGHMESISGMGQFGLTIDPYGNRFVCSNRNPCRQIILENEVLKRNPLLAVADVGTDVSPAGEASHIYPLSRAWTTSNLHAGQFTAACGVLYYQGTALPQGFTGNTFTCDPTGNLVHSDQIDSSSIPFKALPQTSQREFLATRDEWFRPVDLADGPDGALYVVDMYRAVIEHPDWVPPELKNRPDQSWGNDRGRIYRVKRKQPAPIESVDFKQADSKELVATLNHPNGWQRQTAFRLLLEKKDPSVIPELKRLISPSTTSETSTAALWLLADLKSLTPETLKSGLEDLQPYVRETALKLANALTPFPAELIPLILKQSDHSDPRVRFQAALALGNIPDSPEKIQSLAKLLQRDAANPWIVTAALSSSAHISAPLLNQLLDLHSPVSPDIQQVVVRLADLTGAGQKPAEILPLLDRFSKLTALDASPVSLSAMNGLSQGLRRRGSSFPAWLAAQKQESANRHFHSILNAAFQLVKNRQFDASPRDQALSLLRDGDFAHFGPDLIEIAFHDPAENLRKSALTVLAGYHDAGMTDRLLADYDAQTPSFKRTILQALLANSDRTRQLLQLIRDNKFPKSEIDPLTANLLRKHSLPEIKQVAAELFQQPSAAERLKVVSTYQAALKTPGDPVRGRSVFEKNCTTCHRIGQLGQNVAPDISDARDKTPAALLNDILNPNQAIDNNYVSYTVVTKAGKTYTGIIASESATSVTLKQPEGKTDSLLREDIEILRSNGISLMPEGLEKTLPPEQMADLIAFIKNWRYVEENIPYQR